MNLYKSQDTLLKYFSTSVIELGELPFFRYEYMIKNLEEILQKEKSERQRQERENEAKQRAQQSRQINKSRLPGFKMPR